MEYLRSVLKRPDRESDIDILALLPNCLTSVIAPSTRYKHVFFNDLPSIHAALFGSACDSVKSHCCSDTLALRLCRETPAVSWLARDADARPDVS